MTSATQAESQQQHATKDSPNGQPSSVPRIKIKQPGVSYRATLQKLSNTISSSAAEVISRYSKCDPSLVLHFHQSHWKFEQQDGIFLYNSQGRQILEAIRNEQIPVDCLEVFRDVKIKYYEGCLILKLIDHRQSPPSILYTALKPSPESIWTEMLLYSEQTQGNFTDAKALQVESDILVATNPPLDLRPCIHPAYCAQVLADIKDPPLPRLKRKREHKFEDKEEEKLLYLYDEHHGKDFAPDFKRLAFVEAHRRKRAAQQQRAANQTPSNNQQPGVAAQSAASPVTTSLQAQAGTNGSLKRASQSPMVQQQHLHQKAPHSSPQVPAIPLHVQQRPSASPQPGPRQLLNQQAMAQHLAQQSQMMTGSASPRPPTSNLGPQQGSAVQSPAMSNSPLTNDLARQQQIMLQQRAMAIRNMNAARAAGHPVSSPRLSNGNLAQQNGMGSILQGLPGAIQGTPTPLQMQQIRQMQAHQQAQQMAAHAAQQQAAQQGQMGYSNGMMR